MTPGSCPRSHDRNQRLLVYGDPKFEAPLDILHRQLFAYVRRTQVHPNDLGRLRALLIACGQVEQGVHDALERDGPHAKAKQLIASLHAATAYAAEAFYSLVYKELSLRLSILPAPRGFGWSAPTGGTVPGRD